MPTKQNKKFLKKYASTLKNSETSGQGHVQGIPALGAVDGSQDGSKYLGRPPRPHYQGDKGSPSASADTTFSLYSARVNKHWEMFQDGPMFPDQEDGYYDELVNIYKRNDVEPPVTSKLNRKIPARLTSKFSEAYKLNESIAVDITQREFANVVGDSVRQMASGFDGLDWAILIPSLLKNYAEIRYGNNVANNAIEDYLDDPTTKNAHRLNSASNGIAIDILDIIQIVGELMLPSFSGTAFSVSLERSLSQASIMKTALFGGGRIGSVTRTLGFRGGLKELTQEIEPLFKDIPSFVEGFFEFFIKGLEKIAEIETLLEERADYHKLAQSYYGIEEPDALEKIRTWPSYLKDFASEFIEDVVTQPITKLLAITESHNINNLKRSTMKRNDLRVLIQRVLQEYVIDEPDSLHPPEPHSYLFRDPPTVENEEGDVLDDVDKTYDAYAVIVPGDQGVSTYSARPTNEGELRYMIKNILSETKKKRKI